MAVLTLPLYPSAKTRQSLSPSQLATLNSRIAGALAQTLVLPPNKRDLPSIRSFISSYAKDHAYAILEALIWDADHASQDKFSKMSQVEKAIHKRILQLAGQVATDLGLQTVIDLSVVYGRATPKRTRALLASIASSSPAFASSLESDAVPAFTSLLISFDQGLYGLRKIAHVISSFLKLAPPEIIRPFARNKHLVLALATAYDTSLHSLSRSYGGARAERLTDPNATLDDWERVFLETKVELIDVLHVLLQTLLKDVEEVSSAGPALAARCEVAFEIAFALLELQPSRAGTDDTIPFMNCTILEDYQHSYNLSKIIPSVTRRADDPRTELLESALSALNTQDGQSDPGALRLLIRSSGMPPGIDNLGKGPSRVDVVNAKGKGRAPPPRPADPALESAVKQVLDILPDQDPEYVRYVLQHPDFPFKGDGERLIGALLEGTAPQVDSSQYSGGVDLDITPEREPDIDEKKIERRNVFDEEKIDLSQLRIGKKDDTGAVLQDRAFIEQMKADILRRAEAMSDEEEGEDETPEGRKSKGVDIAFEDELDDEGGVKVRDGQASEDEGDQETDADEEGSRTPAKPDTILELAYIRDPKLFDRDAQTRRSKGRQDLKSQTGWGDEQIEGWRIMLERNPNKDRILQKHEFTGNQRGPIAPEASGSSVQRGRGGGRGGRGSRGGRGGGRGRGGTPGPGQGGDGSNGRGDGGSARDRAWKDKNKSSHANHNRKKGHDKKMARVAGPS